MLPSAPAFSKLESQTPLVACGNCRANCHGFARQTISAARPTTFDLLQKVCAGLRPSAKRISVICDSPRYDSWLNPTQNHRQHCHGSCRYSWDLTKHKGGETPLHCAARLDDEGCMAGLLLTRCPKAQALWTTLSNARGETPASIGQGCARHDLDPLCCSFHLLGEWKASGVGSHLWIQRRCACHP